MLISNNNAALTNHITAEDEVPTASLELANGQTLRTYLSIDSSVPGFSTYAQRFDAQGNVIAGSGFEVGAFSGFDTALFPEFIHEFGDGSIGIISSNADENDPLASSITMSRFSITPGATYGSLLSSETFGIPLPSSGTVVDSFIESLLLIDTAGGGVQVAVGYTTFVEFANGNGEINGETVALAFDGNGASLNTLSTAPTILSSDPEVLLSVNGNEFAAIYGFGGATGKAVDIRIVDGSLGTNPFDYPEHLLAPASLTLGQTEFLDVVSAVELANGNLAFLIIANGEDDPATEGSVSFAIMDPSQPPGSSILVDTTTLKFVEGAFIGAETIVALSDGTFVVGWNETPDGLLSGQGFLQHISSAGIPLGAPVSLGVTGGEEFLITAYELANGDLSVSWGQSDGPSDTNGFDVITASFDVVSTVNPVTLKQFDMGDVKTIYDEAILNGEVTASTATVVTLNGTTDPTLSAKLVGTGLSVDPVSGGLVSGEITSIELYDGSTYVGAVFGLTFGAAYYQLSIDQLQNGDPEQHDALFRNLMGTYDASDSVAAVTFEAGGGFATALGSDFADTLTGEEGEQILKGGAGADSLDGGLDADVMEGGIGNDDYFIDDAGDTIVEGIGAGYDEVFTELSVYTLPANVERLNFTDSGNHTGKGNELNNRFAGNSGNDTFVLDEGGADIFSGGQGQDTFDARLGANGIDINLSTGTHGGDAAGDLFASVEVFWGSNSAADTMLTGAARAKFYGFSGNDTLTGGASVDYLDGGIGNDVLSGMGARDGLRGFTGDDILTGGADRDYFQYVFAGFDHDTITDFEDGLDYFRVFSNVADEVSDFTITGNGTSSVLLTLNDGTGENTITVQGSGGANVTIDAGDFLFY
ncbi:calcium-binding protein [Pseudahrensia aquimaris]|uniref:Calcium-binding protein n=1 Tax=Pseudahrensia aquimaris TaxID=744461 RepID=A0ABW3FN85_9HYPH